MHVIILLPWAMLFCFYCIGEYLYALTTFYSYHFNCSWLENSYVPFRLVSFSEILSKTVGEGIHVCICGISARRKDQRTNGNSWSWSLNTLAMSSCRLHLLSAIWPIPFWEGARGGSSISIPIHSFFLPEIASKSHADIFNNGLQHSKFVTEILTL